MDGSHRETPAGSATWPSPYSSDFNLNIEFPHLSSPPSFLALCGRGRCDEKISDFLLAIIVILLLRRMQSRSKGTASLQRRSSSTAHLPKQTPLAFRTLLKRRNETIPAGQLY